MIEKTQLRLGSAAERLIVPLREIVGLPRLFAVIWTSLASSLYFSLGIVSSHALGLTPVVFLLAGLFFALTAMSYLEASAMHPERAGSTVFARYAFGNELASFVAGAAVLLDYVILIAVCALTATDYLATFVGGLGHGAVRVALALGIVAFVGGSNVRGFSISRRSRRIAALVGVDIVIQLAVIVIGLILFFNVSKITRPLDLGSSPSWSGVVFAFTITVVAFTSLESASGLGTEVTITRSSMRRLLGSINVSIFVIYVGMALVAVTAVPVVGGASALGSRELIGAPVIGIVARFHPHALAESLRYLVAGAASLTLIAAANSAMLGLSRLAYSMATNRLIPSGLGRLHPQRSTPFVLIAIAGGCAAALVIPGDLNLLLGIFAFGAMLAFTIAHVSVCVLRFREPRRERPFRIPFGWRVRGDVVLPLPALLGAALSFAAWIGVLVLHAGARYVGLAWVLGGVVLYVAYRKSSGAPIGGRISVPAAALRSEPLRRRRRRRQDYGSILVPLFGGSLDDDIVQTAALLVASEQEDAAAIDKATIEALWIYEVPIALPLDASMPAEQLAVARAALARAKRVGEEYAGVEVATAIVRARRTGTTIVEEARRRGVEAIVLAADDAPRARAGTLLGGRGTRGGESTVGEVIRLVVARAPCRVIITAAPREGAATERPEAKTLPAAAR